MNAASLHAGDPLVCDQLGVGLSGRPLLATVHARLAPGRFTAILGPNGAGKSTLLSMLSGQRAPRSGAVSLGGRALSVIAALELARLRAVLPQKRDSNLITNLGREADMVAAYLALLKMRMEERLTIDFDVPDGLRTAAFPPMMLQSMVENAIKHGLEGKPEGGTLQVRAEVAHNKLRVIVADDGL
eukprot:gene9395-11539_t